MKLRQPTINKINIIDHERKNELTQKNYGHPKATPPVAQRGEQD
jgi:hypothetical protein